MSWLRKLQRDCNYQHTPKPLCGNDAVYEDTRSEPWYYRDSCRRAIVNVTPQPQSASSGLQGLGGGALNKLFAKCINVALLAAMQNVIHLPCLQLSATILDDILKKSSSEQEIVEQIIANIDSMQKDIHTRAFRGELGTNDESAIELLRRIL